MEVWIMTGLAFAVPLVVMLALLQFEREDERDGD